MCQNFQKQYLPTSRADSVISGLETQAPEMIRHMPDAVAFLAQYEGTTFNRGVYRLISLRTTDKWTQLIVAAFPAYAGRIWPFGCDWLGRMFVLDKQTTEHGNPLVLMMELGTGHVLEIPANFETFHERELLENAEAALAVESFNEWMTLHPSDLRLDQCVGYITPLFLGGEDEFENFELTDLEVYWAINGQILEKTRQLPDGEKIGRITLG
jgi:hypothetical protein